MSFASRQPRVNSLRPGPGVCGHSIAVDPWLIISAAQRARLMRVAREVNAAKPHLVMAQINHRAAADRIGIFLVVEPQIQRLPPMLSNLPGALLAMVEEALDLADIVVVLEDHRVFEGIGRRRLNGKVVIDTRGMWR